MEDFEYILKIILENMKQVKKDLLKKLRLNDDDDYMQVNN